MKLIFKLTTLRPNGLNINFNFLWPCFQCILHIRVLKQWFLFVAVRLCLLCTSCARFRCVRTRAVFCMAWLDHSTYWLRRAKQPFDTFKSLLSLVFNLLHSVTHFLSFLLIPTNLYILNAVYIPQEMSVYPPNTYRSFLIIVTVCGFPSQ